AAAAELFAKRGFTRVTMDDIGASCGISGPALYHHFASKEAMLGEMLVSISRYLLDGGRVVAAKGVAPDAALEQLVDFHVDFAVTHPELITVHHRDLVYAPDGDQHAVRRLQRQYVEVWVDIVRQASGWEPSRARVVIHGVFGLLNSTPYTPAIGRVQTADL